jgi:hypothetical protein
MSSNDQAEASIDGTIEVENSEAPSHDLASTSGLEEPETVDPPEEVPLRPGHDHLGFLSWPRLDFDMDQGNHPSDETGSSHGSSQSASVGRNRVDGAVEVSLQIQNFPIRGCSHHSFDQIAVEIRTPRAPRMRTPQRFKTTSTPRSHRTTVLRRQLQVPTMGNMVQKHWGRYVHKIKD